jgi:hypothetical protein
MQWNQNTIQRLEQSILSGGDVDLATSLDSIAGLSTTKAETPAGRRATTERIFSGAAPPPGMRYLNAQVGTVTCPDPGPLQTQCTLVFRVRGPLATSPSTQVVASQYNVSGQFSWLIQRNATNGRGEFGGSVAGSGTVTPAPVSANLPITLADEIGAYSLDSSVSNMTAWRFDGTTWTSLGAGTTLASFTTFDSNSYIRIGAFQTSTNPFNGRIYSVEMRTGLNPAAGTVLWRFDASDYPGFGTVWTDPRGQVWTATSAAAIVANEAVAAIDNSTPDEGDVYIDQTSRTTYLSRSGLWQVAADQRSDINVRAYGATGDGTTNDAAAIQLALTAATPSQFNLSTATVVFPPGNYFIGTTGLTARSSIRMLPGAYLTATAATGVALLVDTASKAEIQVDIRKAIQWFTGVESTSIGLRIKNSDYVRVKATVEGFGCGVEMYGDAAGTAYGVIDLAPVKDCKVGFRCTAVNSGWAHQHEVRGTIRMIPAYTGITGSRYIHLVAGNNVTFVGMSLEGNSPEYTAEIASPFSAFLNCRFEGASPIAYGANSSGGWIIGGYDQYGPNPTYGPAVDVVMLTSGTQPSILSTAGTQIMSSSAGSTQGMIFRSISSDDHGAITARSIADELRAQLTHAGRFHSYKASAASPVFDIDPVTSRFNIGDGTIAATSYITPVSATVNTFVGGWRFARAGTVASSATPTINTDTVDTYVITAQAAAITSFTTNLTGTPGNGQRFHVAITDNGTARAITWGASFEASGTVALPTTTVISTRLDVDFIWNAATSKWRCLQVA